MECTTSETEFHFNLQQQFTHFIKNIIQKRQQNFFNQSTSLSNTCSKNSESGDGLSAQFPTPSKSSGTECVKGKVNLQIPTALSEKTTTKDDNHDYIYNGNCKNCQFLQNHTQTMSSPNLSDTNIRYNYKEQPFSNFLNSTLASSSLLRCYCNQHYSASLLNKNSGTKLQSALSSTLDAPLPHPCSKHSLLEASSNSLNHEANFKRKERSEFVFQLHEQPESSNDDSQSKHLNSPLLPRPSLITSCSELNVSSTLSETVQSNDEVSARQCACDTCTNKLNNMSNKNELKKDLSGIYTKHLSESSTDIPNSQIVTSGEMESSIPYAACSSGINKSYEACNKPAHSVTPSPFNPIDLLELLLLIQKYISEENDLKSLHSTRNTETQEMSIIYSHILKYLLSLLDASKIKSFSSQSIQQFMDMKPLKTNATAKSCTVTPDKTSFASLFKSLINKTHLIPTSNKMVTLLQEMETLNLSQEYFSRLMQKTLEFIRLQTPHATEVTKLNSIFFAELQTPLKDEKSVPTCYSTNNPPIRSELYNNDNTSNDIKNIYYHTPHFKEIHLTQSIPFSNEYKHYFHNLTQLDRKLQETNKKYTHKSSSSSSSYRRIDSLNPVGNITNQTDTMTTYPEHAVPNKKRRISSSHLNDEVLEKVIDQLSPDIKMGIPLDKAYYFDATISLSNDSDAQKGIEGKKAQAAYICSYPGVSWNTRMQSWLVYYEDSTGRKSKTFNPKRLSEEYMKCLPEYLKNQSQTSSVELAMHCACSFSAKVRWEQSLRKALGIKKISSPISVITQQQQQQSYFVSS